MLSTAALTTADGEAPGTQLKEALKRTAAHNGHTAPADGHLSYTDAGNACDSFRALRGDEGR